MKAVKVTKRADRKLIGKMSSVRFADLEEVSSGYIPGEWVCVSFGESNQKLGYVDTEGARIELTDKHVSKIEEVEEAEIAQKTINDLVSTAIKKRDHECSRLFFGRSDGLPGLVIDGYLNCIMVQMRSVGVFRFRERIKSIVADFFPGREVIVTAVPDGFEIEKIDLDKISVQENNLRLDVSIKSFQKNGYYYDHRANRAKMYSMIEGKGIVRGLDLFCYVGSWGLHALKAGAGHVDFVDQADVEADLGENLKINGMEDCGTFVREDAISFLSNQSKEYDLVIADPPAFSKSPKNVNKAKEGYRKLYLKIFNLLKTGYLAAGSCTHGVSFEDLSEIIASAARESERRLRLLDVGIQDSDHPFSSLSDKDCYIKYFFYRVELLEK